MVVGVLLMPAAGQNAPLQGLDLQGRAVDPLTLAPGEALVLIFVRTDCPVSNRYAPTINSMSQKYAGKAEFVMVYPDKSETAESIEKHLHDYGYKLTALRDPQHQLVQLSKVEITPEVSVFNARHELVYYGRIDNWYEDFGRARAIPTTHELDEAISAALNGGQAPEHQNAVGCYISDLR